MRKERRKLQKEFFSFWWVFALLGILLLLFDVKTYFQRYSQLESILFRGKFNKSTFKISKLHLVPDRTVKVLIDCELTIPSNQVKFFRRGRTSTEPIGEFNYIAEYNLKVLNRNTSVVVWSKKDKMLRTERFSTGETIYGSNSFFDDFHKFKFRVLSEGDYDILASVGFSEGDIYFRGCEVEVVSIPDNVITTLMKVIFVISILLLLMSGVLWLLNFSYSYVKFY